MQNVGDSGYYLKGLYANSEKPNILDPSISIKILDILKENKDAILKNVRKINNLSYKNLSKYCSDLFFKIPIPDDLLVLLKELSYSYNRQQLSLLKYLNESCFNVIFDPIVKDRRKKITENSEALEKLKSLDKNENYYLHIFKIDNKIILKEYLNEITEAYIKNIKKNLTIEKLVGDVKYVVDNNNDKYMFDYDFIKLGGLKNDFSEIDDNTEFIDIREYFYFCINNNTDENDKLFKIDIKFLVNYLYKVKDGSYYSYPKQEPVVLDPEIKKKNLENMNLNNVNNNPYIIESIFAKIDLLHTFELEYENIEINKKNYKIVKLKNIDDIYKKYKGLLPITNNELRDFIDVEYDYYNKDEFREEVKSFISDTYIPIDEVNSFIKIKNDNTEYYLPLNNNFISNALNVNNITIPIDCLPLLYLGNITRESNDVIYFKNLDDEDCRKIKYFFNVLHIKNPDISGGRRKRQTMRNKKIQRKRKTMKRAKMQKTKRHKRVNRRKSKKYT